MSRSFQQVMRSSINRSPTKEAHAFPQARRFNQTPSPICQRHSYDLTGLSLSSQIPKRPDTTSKSPRFRYPKQPQYPAPNSYTHRSFIEEAQRFSRGNKINQAERSRKPKVETSPSPDSYSPKLFNSAPYYTMSPRLVKPPKAEYAVGPGAYNLDKYDTVATRRSQIYSKIGQEPRFQYKQGQQEPGPGSYSSGVDLSHSRGKYTFGHQKRLSFPVPNSITPGPGTYQEFSEFAERREHLQSKLQRMTQLLDRNRRSHPVN